MLHSTCWRQSLWAEPFVYRVKQEKVKAESGGEKKAFMQRKNYVE